MMGDTPENQQPEGAVENQQQEGAAENQQQEGAAENQQQEGAAENQQQEGAAVDNGPSNNEESKKRQAPNDSDTQKRPPAKRQKTPESIRKQIEYYFSDENLKRDRFFHPKISENLEGWLEIKHILTCKKIQNMAATQEDILEALADSNLETKIENEIVSIRRTTPLPELDLSEQSKSNNRFGKNPNQRNKPDQKSSRSLPKTQREIHLYGHIIKISGVPEEVSWTKLKEVLSGAILKEMNETQNGFNPLRYVSPVSSQGESFVYCRNFSNDSEIIPKIKTLEINGVQLTVALVDDIDQATKFLEKLPPPIKRDREREHTKFRTDMMTRPLIVGGSTFDSIEHLKKCYRELLDMAELDVELKPTAYKVIRALLDYHPNAPVKAKDVVSIKVAERTDIKEKNKCFFLIRSDGTSEDFSMLKCIDALIKNPPFVDDGENQKKKKNKPEVSPNDENLSTDETATPESQSVVSQILE